MSPNTVIHLFKKIVTKSESCEAVYQLEKGATIPVLVLRKVPTAEQLEKIKEILK